jgi:ATP-binding protein involved in chromosome partitioning
MPELTREAVLEALRSVQDPAQKKDIVSLGLVRQVEISGETIILTLSFTTAPGPQRQQVESGLRAALMPLGVRHVELRQETPAAPRGNVPPERAPLPGVKHLVAVASGKGGVGKTTVAVNLAIALGRSGAAVGLLDADVYGPNVPLMLGTTAEPKVVDERTILPVEAYGVKMISMGLLNPGDRPLIWRGPMLHGVLQQFLRSVRWGELDYLVIDLPPGTGDVALTLVQTAPLSGAVIVTTPSAVSLADVRKAVEMFRQVNVEILGVVENMSYLNCPHCSKRIDIFGHGEGRRMAERFGVPFLGEIEIEPEIRVGGDTGKPTAAFGEEFPGARGFYAVSREVAARLAAGGPLGPTFEIL